MLDAHLISNNYFLGPYANGTYKKVSVKSIHVKRKNVEEATAGRNVCLVLRKIQRSEIKRGMVVLSEQPKNVKSFKAEVIADTKKLLHKGYKPVMIADQYRSAVEVLSVDYEVDIPIRKSDGSTKCNGHRSCAIFKPLYRQCYLKLEDRIVLTDHGVRLVGIVTELYHE